MWLFKKKKQISFEEISDFFDMLESKGVCIYKPLKWEFYIITNNKFEVFKQCCLPYDWGKGVEPKITQNNNECIFEINTALNAYTFYEHYLLLNEICSELKISSKINYEVGNIDDSLAIPTNENFPGINLINKELESNNFACLATINIAAKEYKFKNLYPFYCRIYYNYISDNDSGFPSQELLEDIYYFDEQIKII